MFDSVKFRTNEFKANGSTDRYCQKCQRKKPDRAHHCKFKCVRVLALCVGCKTYVDFYVSIVSERENIMQEEEYSHVDFIFKVVFVGAVC